MQQVQHQRFQIGRHPVGEVAGLQQRTPPFGLQYQGGISLKRQRPGECLIQRYAQRIPVRGRGQSAIRSLLRRHVGKGAGDSATGLVKGAALLHRKPKIKHYSTALWRHQNIGWLYITMQLASRVYGVKPLGHLPQNNTKFVCVWCGSLGNGIMQLNDMGRTRGGVRRMG